MIPIAQKCLLLWMTWIVNGAFERTGREQKGVGGAEGGDEWELRHGLLDG